MPKKIVFLLLTFAASLSAFGQKKLTIDGRIEGMPVYWKLKSNNNLSTIGLDASKLYSYSSLNNRLNIHWYPNSKLVFAAGIRSSYVFGDLVLLPKTAGSILRMHGLKTTTVCFLPISIVCLCNTMPKNLR